TPPEPRRSGTRRVRLARRRSTRLREEGPRLRGRSGGAPVRVECHTTCRSCPHCSRPCREEGRCGQGTWFEKGIYESPRRKEDQEDRWMSAQGSIDWLITFKPTFLNELIL